MATNKSPRTIVVIKQAQGADVRIIVRMSLEAVKLWLTRIQGRGIKLAAVLGWKFADRIEIVTCRHVEAMPIFTRSSEGIIEVDCDDTVRCIDLNDPNAEHAEFQLGGMGGCCQRFAYH